MLHQTWEDNALDVMSDRLSQLEPDTNHAKSSPSPGIPEDVEMTNRSDTSTKTSPGQSLSVSGWRLLDESSGWKPCPIGVYYRTDV